MIEAIIPTKQDFALLKGNIGKNVTLKVQICIECTACFCEACHPGVCVECNRCFCGECRCEQCTGICASVLSITPTRI